MLKLVTTFGVALAVAGPAIAMTFTSSTNGPDTGPLPGQTVIANFDTAAGLSGGYSLVTGTVSGQYAAPYLDDTQYLAVAGGQTATYTLAKAASSLSFYWGSIDDYNTVSFYNGGTLLGSFTGSQVPPAPADGSQGNPLNNRRVSFLSDSGKVTSIVFTSTQNAFELDTLATGGVPEPATWGLMIAGFALVGLGARKRRNLGSVAA